MIQNVTDAKPLKPLVWPAAEIKTPPFSASGRMEASELLLRLQSRGILDMPHSRPLPSIGSSCHEVRLHRSDFSWRIVYCIDWQGIVILTVFTKKTRATPWSDIEICKRRLAAYQVGTMRGVRMLKPAKSKQLAKAGWRVGSVQEFLGLSDEEAALIEIRIALSRSLRERRVAKGLSQEALALKIGSSQSRVAKMESTDPTVTLDLLIRSLLALGASTADIAKALKS